MIGGIRRWIVAGWSVEVFAIAFALNSIWELAQAPLYQSMGSAWEATRRCFVASVGDGALILIILTAIRGLAGRASVERQYTLAVVFGVAVASAVEWWGLTAGRWAYGPQMPIVPGTALGIVPLLQLAILTPLTMWCAGRTTVERA